MKIRRGFTLIEMLVVMVVIAMLLTIATPRYLHSVDRARENVLRENLLLMRDALDKHFADHGRYPDALVQLVERRYLRAVPVDPLTDSAETWLLVAPQRADLGVVYDVRSGAEGTTRGGVAYGEL
ncbi:MAG: prepilin-type N-terminal cleavage/methylation domain-containing protein [Rhodocyclaceae bacterium]|nr:prepilin-type N-terminal cleavage/methylation domain-containing protein [Rhodocyclaceae bacterium]